MCEHAASLLAVALHILCAASATYSEGWSFMTSLYAWFTTFTTIGFGDYETMFPLRHFKESWIKGKSPAQMA